MRPEIRDLKPKMIEYDKGFELVFEAVINGETRLFAVANPNMVAGRSIETLVPLVEIKEEGGRRFERVSPGARWVPRGVINPGARPSFQG